jgi:hypothetical protein
VSRIEADADGDTTDADAGGDTGDAANEVGEDGDSATTPEESAALRPWTDPLPHPTTTIPMTAAHAAPRRVAFICPPLRNRSPARSELHTSRVAAQRTVRCGYVQRAPLEQLIAVPYIDISAI